MLDSGSTDDTVERARALGAHVVSDPGVWPGFGPQKNRALALARGDWVLSIDADEVVTPQLRDAILACVDGNAQQSAACDGAWIKRRSQFCGRWIDHGDWRNDWVLRLFRRNRGRFSDDVVHERVLCDGPQIRLAGQLLHWTMPDLDDARRKILRYAEIGAQRRAELGKRGGRMRGAASGFWTFLRGYLIRGGLLDGRAGFDLARLNAWGAYRKYADIGRFRTQHSA